MIKELQKEIETMIKSVRKYTDNDLEAVMNCATKDLISVDEIIFLLGKNRVAIKIDDNVENGIITIKEKENGQGII